MDKRAMIEVLTSRGIKVDGRTGKAKIQTMYDEAIANEPAVEGEVTAVRSKAERANRVTIVTTECGYEARFYRTHKLVCKIQPAETGWVADSNANSTTNRENFRNYICENASSYGVLWRPDIQEQAWERKHNVYMTDADVAEDAEILITPALGRLASKCKWDMEIESIDVTAITPKDTNLSYVEDGKYIKSGAWCVADIELEVHTVVNGNELDMIYATEMKSGQICKPKTTIAQWEHMILVEADLRDIVLEVAKEA